MQRIFGKKKSNRNQICRIIERTNGRVRCIQIVSVLWRWFNRGFWVGLLILLRECIKLVHNRTFYSCSDTVLYGCTNAYSLYTASVALELSINVDTIRLSGGKETITDKEQPLFTIIAHANSPRFYGVVVMFSPVALSPSLPISFAFSLSLSLSPYVCTFIVAISRCLCICLCHSADPCSLLNREFHWDSVSSFYFVRFQIHISIRCIRCVFDVSNEMCDTFVCAVRVWLCIVLTWVLDSIQLYWARVVDELWGGSVTY